MTTTATPYGLRAVNNQTADVRPKGIDGGIASGYASSIYYGSPVTMSTNGTLNVATTTSLLCGMFAGVRYQPDASSMYTYAAHWPASQTYVAGTCTAYVVGYDDPLVMYEIQANGSISQSGALGAQANPVNPSSGTGDFSLCSLNSTFVGSGSSGTFRILDVAPRPNNAWGDSFTVVYVQIAAHQYYAQKNQI